MEMSKYPFNYQIGKLYRYNGLEEKIFLINDAPHAISSIFNGDIVCFLTEPYKKMSSFYCRILHSNGVVGEIFWDIKTFDIFLLVLK